MTITITYRVDQDRYHASTEKHDITLITTEYKHRSDLLVHLQMGKKLCVSLNNRLSDLLTDGNRIPNEQFLFRKTYHQGDSKLITRSAFEEKLSRFDKSQTVIEREILENYTYADKNGLPGHVQIAIAEKSDATLATIDFGDAAKYENFICPSWLIRLE